MSVTLPWGSPRSSWEDLLDDVADRVADRILTRVLGELDGAISPVAELLTAREVCDLLHLSRSSLDRLVRQGLLRVHKVGTQNRYPRSSVDAYLNDTRRTA